MAHRRRRRRKPVEVGDLTFFSFQDIMTCVTGILLLLTLMMVLANLNRPDVSAKAQPALLDDSTADTRAKQWAAGVHAAATTERADSVWLAAGMDAVHAMLGVVDANDAAGGMDRVLTTLPDLLRASADRIAKGRARLLALDERLRALQTSTQDAERQTATFNEDAKKAAKQVTFLPGRQDARPVLVEMDDARSTIGTLDAQGRPRRLATTAAGQELDAICQAADGLKPDTASVVLLVRPAAVGRMHDLVDAVQGRNLTVGWDAAPAAAVFPEGAADGTP